MGRGLQVWKEVVSTPHDEQRSRDHWTEAASALTMRSHDEFIYEKKPQAMRW
jgi:hypothetical protein